MSGSEHILECSSSSCHILLQCTHPPGTLVLQAAKCQTKDSSPLQAGKLQGPWFSSKSLS